MFTNPYYKVGKFKVDNSFKAVLIARDKGIKLNEIELILSDSFNTFDFTSKNYVSIREVEDSLCQKINSLGKPLRLCFSAGVDSTTIANAFARNKINPTYLIIHNSSARGGSFNSTKWISYKMNLLRDIHYKHSLPEPTVEFIDSDIELLTRMYTDPKFYLKGFDLGLIGNMLDIGINKILHTDYDKSIQYLNITGLEKPYISYINSNFYWHINDLNILTGSDKEINILNFFLNDLEPSIISCQAHEVIKYIKNTSVSSEDYQENLDSLQSNLDQYPLYCNVLRRKFNDFQLQMSIEDKKKFYEQNNIEDIFIRVKDKDRVNNYLNFKKRYSLLTNSNEIIPISTPFYKVG